MSSASKFDIQRIARALALFLGVFVLWTFVTEIVRPASPPQSTFPNRIPPQDINSKRLTGEIAATIGIVRGDLWSDRVLVDAANIIQDQEGPINLLASGDVKTVQTAAERALLWRPLDSRIWLVLAAITSGDTGQQDRANQQLKMSYYTGPNDKAAISHRLKLVMTSHALNDAELRELVRREIRTILLRASELRPAIVAAYRTAQPQDREFIETTVSTTDPSFVATLKAGLP